MDEFAKWAHMTPAEKIRAQYLEKYNLTEDSLKNLPPAEQKAINDQITAEIKQQLGGNNQADGGGEADSTAAAYPSLELPRNDIKAIRS
ncbi:hypothetical protein PY650_01520 [Rhizobium calliandrae]|uniref:DUF3072 domain-containing protein n=1 Tax=Rhizobium calliandrae TaxID=1312182 RepID=A0ABT7K6W7_9HYPH|nr:hypothetical protein [Rhizobium calliandrae]MDL2404355.1 hypothetical protein [Rhizobium calliandrae]